MNRLILTYDPEDGNHGRLTAKVESDGFVGHSSAWFSVKQLDAFGDALLAFPITADSKPSLGGGFWKNDSLDQAHITICIEPAGPRGDLRVIVALAMPPWDLGRVDQNSVRAQFFIKYSDLDAFLPVYREMVAGREKEIRLEASPT